MKKFIYLLLLLVSTLSIANEPFSLKSIFRDYAFVPDRVQQFRSFAKGEQYTVLEKNGQITAYDFASGQKQQVVLSPDKLDIPLSGIHTYRFNQTEDKVLISTDIVQQYRHSYFARYYIVDLDSHKATPLTDEQVQLATWSGSGDQIAYVRENNLYYYDLPTGEHVQVTRDGEKNRVINGAADWVYEEEFRLTTGFQWSPDGQKIAFYRFNEERVKSYTINFYRDLYPSQYTYKYPKAGEQNAIVDILVYDLASGTTQKMDVGQETDQYIPRIKWTPDGKNLCMVRLNRLQNHVEVLLADPDNGQSKLLYEEHNDHYIKEIGDGYITFLQSEPQFIIHSEADGYLHLYRYDMEGKLINQITQGTWDIFDFYGVDEANNRLYYRSNERSVIERHVYAVDLDGQNKTLLTPDSGVNKAEFSAGFQYFVHSLTNTDEPLYVSMKDHTGKQLRVMEDNQQLKAQLSEQQYQSREFMQIPTEDGTLLNGYLVKPPDFDSTQQYPVLMYVYGGPESQIALNEYYWFTDAWFNLMAQQGYIVACFDNRGTDGRGEAFRKSTYRQLGKLETIDQISVARYLGDLDYVDAKRIGIMGKSYGGYLSSLCILKGADVFSMAIAVAPVTNWRFYDTIYTERFMRTPQENPDGYDENSPIHFTHLLEDPYLLIHGMGDDNVHLQNSVELTEKLVQDGKHFDMFYYPNRRHSIYGNNALLHVYEKMTDFVLGHL